MKPTYHARVHRANSADPIPVLLHKKVFSDSKPVATTGGEFYVTITDDLGGTYLRSAHAALTVAGASDLEVQLHNVDETVDMLATVITVDSGDRTSYTANVQHEIATTGVPPANRVSRGDLIRIDVDSAAGTGLELLLEFGPQLVRITPP